MLSQDSIYCAGFSLNVPAPPFNGYQVEARPKQSFMLDQTKNPGEACVGTACTNGCNNGKDDDKDGLVDFADLPECAGGGGVPGARDELGLPFYMRGLPANYEEGVVISLVQDARALARPITQKFGPVEVQRRATPANGDSLRQAAFRPGDSFEDPDIGLTVTVMQKNADGSFNVKITWVAPPAPDVVALDAWLDNPANGFGTFWTADGDGDGAPDLFGDPVFRSLIIRWQPGSPGSCCLPPVPPTPPIPLPPELGTVTHKLNLRVKNIGTATAESVTGTLCILRPEIPAAFDPTSLLSLCSKVIPITFGNISKSGGIATRSVELQPDGPFAILLLLDRARGEGRDEPELALINNFHFEPFLLVQVAPAALIRRWI